MSITFCCFSCLAQSLSCIHYESIVWLCNFSKNLLHLLYLLITYVIVNASVLLYYGIHTTWIQLLAEVFLFYGNSFSLGQTCTVYCTVHTYIMVCWDILTASDCSLLLIIHVAFHTQHTLHPAIYPHPHPPTLTYSLPLPPTHTHPYSLTLLHYNSHPLSTHTHLHSPSLTHPIHTHPLRPTLPTSHPLPLYFLIYKPIPPSTIGRGEGGRRKN